MMLEARAISHFSQILSTTIINSIRHLRENTLNMHVKSLQPPNQGNENRDI